MRKRQNLHTKKINIPIMIISTILALFALICIIIIISNKSYTLVLGTIGIILLILTMNIANIVKITKDNMKIMPITSLVLNILSIVFLFKHVIFSYVLTVPALILTIKCIKYNKKNKLNIVCFAISLILLIICFTFSIGGYIKKF